MAIITIIDDGAENEKRIFAPGGCCQIHFVMAGLVPAIHVFAAHEERRGCPAQGRT
jgi:hypothetical protein